MIRSPVFMKEFTKYVGSSFSAGHSFVQDSWVDVHIFWSSLMEILKEREGKREWKREKEGGRDGEQRG